jgi:hypothetical protein
MSAAVIIRTHRDYDYHTETVMFIGNALSADILLADIRDAIDLFMVMGNMDAPNPWTGDAYQRMLYNYEIITAPLNEWQEGERRDILRPWYGYMHDHDPYNDAAYWGESENLASREMGQYLRKLYADSIRAHKEAEMRREMREREERTRGPFDHENWLQMQYEEALAEYHHGITLTPEEREWVDRKPVEAIRRLRDRAPFDLKTCYCIVHAYRNRQAIKQWRESYDG